MVQPFHYYVTNTLRTLTDLIFTTLETSQHSDTYRDIQRTIFHHHFGQHITGESEVEIEDQTLREEELSLFTLKELQHGTRKQISKKAPGFDRLDARVMKNLVRKFPSLILNLMNKCLQLKCFPKTWKKGVLIFFYKKNKDPQLPSSYRPITLLPMLGKLLERLIKMRTIISLESSNYLDNDQHGFRERKSTTTALLSLKENINNSLQQHKYVSIVSFDITGAFDAINWKSLKMMLKRTPIPGHIRSLLNDFIQDRFMGFEDAEGTEWNQVYRGCPQGSCLGPLLWTIIADQILKGYKQTNGKIQAYADDFVIIGEGDTRTALENNINTGIKCFQQLCSNFDLQISISKTKAMLFGRYLLARRHPIFKLRESTIPVVKTLQYLGILLDSKFTFTDHLTQLKTKVLHFVQGFINFKSYHKGISPDLLKYWYNTVTLKQISYGFQVWFPNLNSNGMSKLKSLQRLAILNIIKVYRSTSTPAICVLSGITPIEIFLSEEYKAFETIQGRRPLLIEQTSVEKQNLMSPIPSHQFPEYYKINNLIVLDDRDYEIDASTELQVFTDGSKMQEGTASAFVAYYKGKIKLEKSHKHHQFNSVYQAEMYAIYAAIKWFASSLYQQILIQTDSQASILTLQNPYPTNTIMLQIFQVLKQIPKKNLYIRWTKAHVGTEGNERADLLAKQAISVKGDDINRPIKFPLALVKTHCKKLMLGNWQQDWENNTKGRDLYRVINKIDPKYICKIPTFANYLSAHGSFPAFLYKIKKLSSPGCNCKKSAGTVIHYIFGKCPLMKYHFKFKQKDTVRQNLKRILLNPQYATPLIHNYNNLNKMYSFIRKDIPTLATTMPTTLVMINQGNLEETLSADQQVDPNLNPLPAP